MKRAVVIGAGIGGLSAAIRLAARGCAVTVVEQGAQVGGKMGEVVQDGFRWDTGPSVITMRHVFEELFAVADARLDDYLTLLPIDPLTRYFWADGRQMDARASLSAMAEQIAQFDPRDVEGYLRYLAYAAQIHRITGPVFIYDRPPRPASFARVPITDWLKADPFRTMDGAIRAHVRSPQMRQFLGRFATYVGGSPYEAPATLNVIAHVELVGGVWYPQGGIYAIARAYERLARQLGVTIALNSPVQHIRVEDGRAVGVVLRDGALLDADAVICNVDVADAYRHLLPQTEAVRRRFEAVSRQERSCSGFVMLLGVEGQHERLAHHNILFGGDYQREFGQIFKQRVPADDPTVYIAITSKTDSAHAPAGHENWFVLVNAPANTALDWPALTETYGERVLGQMARFGFDMRGRIVTKRVLTPRDLASMTGAFEGALYGASANSKWAAFRRPHNRCEEVRGVYFAGGTTHPGGGVPMVTLSGKVAAELALEDVLG